MKKSFIAILVTAIAMIAGGCTSKEEPAATLASGNTAAVVTASPTEAVQGEEIEVSEESAIGEDWTVLAEHEVTFGGLEGCTVRLAADAEKSGDDIMWDDSHNWVLEVETRDGIYRLFEQRVSLGQVYFDIMERYDEDGNAVPVILLHIDSSAEISTTEYTYDGGFEEKEVYREAGINRIYSSVPEYR